MAYIVNRFNGTQLVVVEDGTIDQTTDIKLIGKNYSGYGEAQNENLLHILESFSGTTAPTKAISGQVWYDSAISKLKFYTGSAWKVAGGAEISATEPAGLAEGELWWNTTNNQLYGKTGTGEFLLVGPQSAGAGTTQMLSVTVKDSLDADKPVIVAMVNDSPIYIVSGSEFTLKAEQAAGIPSLTGFSKVKNGFTLVNSNTGQTVNASGNPVTGASGEPIIWGTANDALNLGGIPAASYLTSSGSNFSGVVRFADAGFTVGGSNDLAVTVATDTANIKNNIGQKIIFGTSRSGSAADDLLSIRNVSTTETGLFPESDNAYYIGSSTAKFAEVHATSFNGTATKATTVDVGGTGRNASTAGTANTIAARDSSGNITAVVFNGTATKARYADLAEKYSTDKNYPIGTAMTISGEKWVEEKEVSSECRAAKSSDICIGVISAQPAYLMNSEADGQAIGLKGRLPIRVAGVVKKGEAIYAWADGVCGTTATRALVGVALETNTDENEKLVECVLKT